MIKEIELIVTHIAFIATTLLIYEYTRVKILNLIDDIMYKKFSAFTINNADNRKQNEPKTNTNINK